MFTKDIHVYENMVHKPGFPFFLFSSLKLTYEASCLCCVGKKIPAKTIVFVLSQFLAVLKKLNLIEACFPERIVSMFSVLLLFFF